MPLFKARKKEDIERGFSLPELPAFPEINEIKEALRPSGEVIPPLPPYQAYQALPSYPSPVQAQPLQKPDIKKTQEIGPPIELTQEIEPLQTTAMQPITERVERVVMGREPIFIKIDRFKESLENFELIKQKIDEIDELLKQTREIRQKEQEEFDAWEHEILEIKEKVNSIDEKLFSKIV